MEYMEDDSKEEILEKVVISFCVPSYNRAEYTVRTVESILHYRGSDIEVVVTDNCSSDDTVEQLKKLQIIDSRLYVHVNEENIGAAANFVESLKYGRGKYLFVVFSRETINVGKISDLIACLRKADYAVGYCGEDQNDRENIVCPKGVEGLSNIGYKTLHPTGYIFNRSMLQEIISLIRPEDANKLYRNFPHDFWAAELALKGSVIFYNKKIRIRVDRQYLKKVKSMMRDKEKEVWFFPHERIIQLKLYIKHMKKMGLELKILSQIFPRCYMIQLSGATVDFQKRMKDETVCDHYGICKRRVSFFEMLCTVQNIKKEVRKDIKENQLEVGLKAKLVIALSYEIVLGWVLKEKIKSAMRKLYGIIIREDDRKFE